MKIKICSSVTLVIGALLVATEGLQGAVPSVVTVKGELGRISAGVATNVTGNSQEMALSIYSSTNAPTALFGRTKVPVLLDQGGFVAEMGNGSSLTNVRSGAAYSSLVDMLADASGNTFYLGLQPTGLAANLFPMMRLQSMPFALVAGDAKQATKTFEVLNGTATLATLIVQGQTELKGPVAFEASSAPVFNQQVSIAGDIKVTSGVTTLSAITVERSSTINNATVNGVTVSGGDLTVNGNLAVTSGLTTVNGVLTMSPGKTLTVLSNLTASGTLNATSFQARNVNVSSAFTIPKGAKLKEVFGLRACVTNKVTTPPATDSGWSNSFYQVTSTSGVGTSVGYWKAPQDCFISASYVVGRYGTGEEPVKPIALMSTSTTDYSTIANEANCIVLTYIRHDLSNTYAAQKGSVCLFMRKGQYLCWHSGYDNEETVFGSGYMREISVLYFAN